MLRTLLRRFKPRPKSSLVIGITTVHVVQPTALTSRAPEADDRSRSGFAWWGHWERNRWIWIWDKAAWDHHTHWLPASVEVLPVRCYQSEVQP